MLKNCELWPSGGCAASTGLGVRTSIHVVRPKGQPTGQYLEAQGEVPLDGGSLGNRLAMVAMWSSAQMLAVFPNLSSSSNLQLLIAWGAILHWAVCAWRDHQVEATVPVKGRSVKSLSVTIKEWGQVTQRSNRGHRNGESGESKNQPEEDQNSSTHRPLHRRNNLRKFLQYFYEKIKEVWEELDGHMSERGEFPDIVSVTTRLLRRIERSQVQEEGTSPLQIVALTI